MLKKKKVVLDYIKGIELDRENPPLNNLHALNYLPSGIFTLVDQVGAKENEILRRPKHKVPSFSLIFNRGHGENITVCCFHWFAISIINYVRLIGLIDIMNKNNWKVSDIAKNREKISKYCTEYVREVIPAILLWRNKVAGHFAITNPRKEDNLATLEMSIMHPLTYLYPHYEVSAGKLSTEGETGEIPQWSLIKEFEKLIPRYWPNAKVIRANKKQGTIQRVVQFIKRKRAKRKITRTDSTLHIDNQS